MFANLSQYFPSHQKYGTLVLVHRYELIQQAKEAFEAWSPGLRIGIEQGSQTVKDLSTVRMPLHPLGFSESSSL
jgi:superfamily II DNA or RNA helicase